MDITETNRRVVAQFRGGGEIDGMHRDRLVLLTTTGRRTGNEVVTPLMFHRDGERVLIVASNVGSAANPQWYRNLQAEPHVTVEIGDESYPAVATTITGADRAGTWATLTQAYPFLVDHEASTERTIPVVALTRT